MKKREEVSPIDRDGSPKTRTISRNTADSIDNPILILRAEDYISQYR